MLVLYNYTNKKINIKRMFLLKLDEPRLGLIQEYLMKGLEEVHVESYYEYMVEVAVLLGVDKGYAMEELRKSLDFEIELAMVR